MFDAANYSAADFAEEFNVSRETMVAFTGYAALLGKWQQKINLVGPATLPDLWLRHMADSAQIFELSGRAGGTWLDLGSGAGFPGLVVALLIGDSGTAGKVHLVESDRRKAAFLQTVIRETGAPAELHVTRIEQLAENLPPALAQVDFISARALTALPQLLAYAAPFCNSSTIAWFSKGRDWQEELTQAAQSWKLNVETHASRTESAARILALSNMQSRQSFNHFSKF